MNELKELFMVFLKIGGFTFGGGYAMLPLIEREIVENKEWATQEEIMDCFAIAQCTPGVIAVNTATFVGYKRKGVIGAIISTLGIVIIPIIIILTIASFLKAFADYPIVKNALWGISVAVCATILVGLVNMAKKSVKGIYGIIMFLLAFLVSVIFNISPVYIVCGCGLIGIILKK